jgi:MFS family permease
MPTILTAVGDRSASADSPYAWMRLVVSMLLSTIGGVGVWSYVVVLPTVQAEFGIARADASLPYTLITIGFAVGGVLMGRLADRVGIVVPLIIGGLGLGAGYVAVGFATTFWQVAVLHGVLIGMLGTSASFGPLMADVSHWFVRRRGLAVSLAASGNYLAGAIWPPVVQHFVETAGWRAAYIGIGIFCFVTMAPLALLLRRRRSEHQAVAATASASARSALGLSPNTLQMLLSIASFSCCVAMSMPQVHIVAYCGDLGYGVARGAEMLSLMLGLGIVSRIASGFVADRLGGIATLLIGSLMQATALTLYLGFSGLGSLFVISGLFGLFQGGIVPSYAIIVREYFPPAEAGTRVGVVLMASLFGMAFGGWVSGVIFDLTGSYAAAFANGLAWNLWHLALALWLLMRRGPRPQFA